MPSQALSTAALSLRAINNVGLPAFKNCGENRSKSFVSSARALAHSERHRTFLLKSAGCQARSWDELFFQPRSTLHKSDLLLQERLKISARSIPRLQASAGKHKARRPRPNCHVPEDLPEYKTNRRLSFQ